MADSDQITNHRTAAYENGNKMKTKKKKSKSGSFSMPRLACFGGIKSELDGQGNFDMEVDDRFRRRTPHLVIMVNGLIGRLVSLSLSLLCFFFILFYDLIFSVFFLLLLC